MGLLSSGVTAKREGDNVTLPDVPPGFSSADSIPVTAKGEADGNVGSAVDDVDHLPLKERMRMLPVGGLSGSSSGTKSSGRDPTYCVDAAVPEEAHPLKVYVRRASPLKRSRPSTQEEQRSKAQCNAGPSSSTLVKKAVRQGQGRGQSRNPPPPQSSSSSLSSSVSPLDEKAENLRTSTSLDTSMVEENMSTSQAYASKNAGTSLSSKNKLVITLNAFGQPVGEHSHRLATRSGDLVRTHVSVAIKNWRAVPMSKKEELWKLLQDEFVLSQSYKDKCFKSMSDMFRKYKTKLRMEYLDPHINHDDKLNNRPPRVRPEDWESFIQHNSDPKTIEQRKKNAENRKNMKIYHTSGRHGHARIEEEMKCQKKDGDTPISRTEVWIKAHTRKDGSIHSNVSSHMDRVKELLSSQESNSHDILKDPLTRVFGLDTRGQVRGVGTTVSRTQIRGSAAALEKISSYKRKIDEQSSTIQELSSKINFLMQEVGGIKEMMQQQRMASSFKAKTSVQPENPQSTGVPLAGNHQCVERMRPCKLYSWRRELVAEGRVVLADGPQTIHGKPLREDSYKVAIDIIVKGDAELPEPDGYHSTLGEVGIGSFVAWHHHFVEFTD